MIEFRGERYYDDRLFVLALCRGRYRDDADGVVETTIFHEPEPADGTLSWCLATFRNCANFPLVAVHHFNSRDDALKYMGMVEPIVPLVSLGGRGPERPLSRSEFLAWKQANGMKDYDYNRTFQAGGSNPKEVILQTSEQFAKSQDDVARRLGIATTSTVQPSSEALMVVKALFEFVTEGNAATKGFIEDLIPSVTSSRATREQIERVEFCLQIADYFLAWKALNEMIREAPLKKAAIEELHDKIREFYESDRSRVRVINFIVSPEEIERFVSMVRTNIRDQAAPVNIGELTSSKLTIFDTVAVERLRQYGAKTAGSGGERLGEVAGLVISHALGGKVDTARASVPRSILGNVLLGNYTVAQEIVARTKDLRGDRGVSSATNPQNPGHGKIARDAPASPIPFSPSLPDITKKNPMTTFSDGDYTMFIIEDVDPMGGGGFIKYQYVAALFRRNVPVCFVTLERSSVISNVLCVFENDGTRSNHGQLNESNLAQEFMARSKELMRQRFAIGDLKEVQRQQERRPWWKW